MSIVPVDTSSEVSVTTLLENARTWLLQAVEASPMEVAFVKAQLATAAEATKQLNLSREIQDDALEMVRRAEYALGKAIRKGQVEGTVRTRADGGYPAHKSVLSGDTYKSSPTDFASLHELTGGGNSTGIYALVDGADDAQFEVAIEQAKHEGNLSRANVVRKVKGQQSPTTRDQRADLITKLANQGYSSRQMPARVGVTEESVRQIARDYDIDIPADKYVGRTRRINSSQLVENTATALEGLVSGVELIDYGAVDPATASQWADSLDDSLKKLRSFANQIRKATQ